MMRSGRPNGIALLASSLALGAASLASRLALADTSLATLYNSSEYSLYGRLLPDANGNLYFTETDAGTYGRVSELEKPANGSSVWKLHILHTFTNGGDGAYPYRSLIADAAGNLYGITEGHSLQGTVFELSPPAKPHTPWSWKTLHTFTDGSDGGFPQGDLVMDASGALYGTTEYGGGGVDQQSCVGQGCGVVFKLTPPADGKSKWTETVLYAFCEETNCTDGYAPIGGVVLGPNGILYGTTWLGGPELDCECGTVFRLTPPEKAKQAWAYDVLHTFTSNLDGGVDGGAPMASLLLDGAGAIYGTTVLGGPYFQGTVFKLTPPAPGKKVWLETQLHAFGSGADGTIPHAALLFDSKGNLFGTALAGGTYGYGMAFELLKPGGKHGVWLETDLWDFNAGASGDRPYGGLIFDQTLSHLFGTTSGQSNEAATVFELTLP